MIFFLIGPYNSEKRSTNCLIAKRLMHKNVCSEIRLDFEAEKKYGYYEGTQVSPIQFSFRSRNTVFTQ